MAHGRRDIAFPRRSDCCRQCSDYESLSHTAWTCKYHVVFIPKCRRKALYLELRRHLGEMFRKLALQKESKIEEGHLMPDHVHMLLSILPKYAVSQVVGHIKISRPDSTRAPDRTASLNERAPMAMVSRSTSSRSASDPANPKARTIG